MPLRYVLIVLFLVTVCASSPARAVLFVSPAGSDNNNCSQATPCATIATAFSKAGVNDTIICLGPVGSSSNGFIINKSIEIDCSAGPATFTNGVVAGSNALIVINIPVIFSDPFRTVRLRGFLFTSYDLGIRIDRGLDIKAASAVFLENVIVSGSGKSGILDERTGGQTRLYVTDSIIRDGTGPGIVAVSQATGITVLDNVRSENNGYGIAVGAGNNVVIRNSVFSGNSTAGVEGDGGSQIIVDGSTITHNNIGIQSNGSVHMSNNNVAFNNTAISGSAGTYGNNRFSGNGSVGTAPTALGGATSDLGQQ
jgi:hypothetical protein